MKGDFTRRTFRAGNHYRGVLMQQGRVQLDADWNEQHEIALHHEETALRDTIGGDGGPADGAGFALVGEGGGEAVAVDRPWISGGRYYVDGALCENEALLAIDAQPDNPGFELPAAEGYYVAYLEVWREHLTAVEEPRLREVALGGLDTTTRSRTIWQVHLDPIGSEEAYDGWVAPGSGGTAARLRARTKAAGAPEAPAAGYGSLDNQLYRVEVHTVDPPTFVWSRENGAVVASAADIGAERIVLDAPPPDDRHGFAPGDLVEVTDLARTRRGLPGALARLGGVAGVTLEARWIGDPPGDLDRPTVRRWDCAAPQDIAVDWADLERGVQVGFEDGGTYRVGDHWLIPARAALFPDDPGTTVGDVDWPRDGDEPAYRTTDGTPHRFAPLALLHLGTDGWTHHTDLRHLFGPLSLERPIGYRPAVGNHVHMARENTANRRRIQHGYLLLRPNFKQGLVVETDEELDPAVADNAADTGSGVVLDKKPILTVTVDLPYPLSLADRTWPGQLPAGTQAVTLDGTTTLVDGNRSLAWTPADGALRWLDTLATSPANTFPRGRLRCRLVVRGRWVVTARGGRVLNGVPRTVLIGDGRIAENTPSIDDVWGGDYEVWFWLQMNAAAGFFNEPDSDFDHVVFQ